mgnify:CR=1 FL=1
MTKTNLFSSTLLAVSLILASPAVFAAGESSGGGGEGEATSTTKPPKKTKTTITCRKGLVYDKKTKMCHQVDSHNFTDDQLYLAAREMAYVGQYANALHVLNAAENQDDPRILNYRGFTNRKLGNHAKAMEYYQAALRINPDYILARSYMGQGLLAYGDEEGARIQLAEIRERGGRNTWAYTSLQMALRGAPSNY